MKYFLAMILSFTLAGCFSRVVGPPPYDPSPPPAVELSPPEPPVRAVYLEPPFEAPPPIAVRFAPPPMRYDPPPLNPYYGAEWVGGYWVWENGWVWMSGHWMAAPRPGYFFRPPYYENRSGLVIFVGGYWSAQDAVFTPPPPTAYLRVSEAPPYYRGHPPVGPSGVFVPAPPGSHFGIIVPAPAGTSPQVVVSAPPLIRPGMYVQHTAVNNIHVSNVILMAPPGTTANGAAVRASVPSSAHLAAGMAPVVRSLAPPTAAPGHPTQSAPFERPPIAPAYRTQPSGDRVPSFNPPRPAEQRFNSAPAPAQRVESFSPQNRPPERPAGRFQAAPSAFPAPRRPPNPKPEERR